MTQRKKRGGNTDNIKRLPKMRCPRCGARPVIRQASYVYGEKAAQSKARLLVCRNYPACDTYTSIHGKQVGRLADRKLRQLRIEAHRLQELLVRHGVMSKANIYFWMRYHYMLTPKQAHISMFDREMCRKVIADYQAKLDSHGVQWKQG